MGLYVGILLPLRDSILCEVDPIMIGVLGNCYERGPCTSLVEHHTLVERPMQLWGVMGSTTMSGAGVFDQIGKWVISSKYP